jgi:hypothetical protein
MYRLGERQMKKYPVATVARPWAFECSHRLATVATGKLFPAARLTHGRASFRSGHAKFTSRSTNQNLAIPIKSHDRGSQ